MSTHDAPKPCDPRVAAAAYAELEPEIATLAGTSLAPIRVDVLYAVGLALGTAERIQPLVPRMLANPDIDAKLILGLAKYAAACQHADEIVGPIGSSLAPLVGECEAMRGRLLFCAEVLSDPYDLLDPVRVAAIREPRSLDLAGDLGRLVALYRDCWSRVVGKCPVTPEILAQTEALARDLRAKLMEPRVTIDPQSPEGVRRSKRLAAFALLEQAYEECRRAVAFLRWYEDDLEWIAPQLSAKRSLRWMTDEYEPDEETMRRFTPNPDESLN